MARPAAYRSSRRSFSSGSFSATLLAVCFLCLLAGAGLLSAQEPADQPPEGPGRTAEERAARAPEAPAPDGEETTGEPSSPDAPPTVDEGSPETPPPGRRRLETIVVTATSLEEEDFYVPYVVDSLEGEALTSRKAFRTFPEALREVPGVMIQKTSHGQGSPFIRGFTGFRTLLLLDGIRLNNAVFRDGPNQYWNTVDPLTIDRLEVVKGPSSVLYGSDAIGGTVNAFTRSRAPFPPDSEAAFEWSRRVYYRYGSAEDSHVARGEVSAAHGTRLGLLGGVSYKDFGNLAAGRGTDVQPNTAYDELNGDLKGILRLRPDLDLVAAFQRVGQDDVPRTHSTVFSKSFRGTVAGTDLRRDFDQTRTLGYTQLHWKPEEVAWLNRASASFSFQLQEEEEMRVRSNMRLRRQGFDDATYGVWFRLESPSPLGTLSYGVEYYRDEVDSFFREFETDGSLREVRPRGPVADDASYDLVGVYLQDSFRPLERWEVILGGRFNYARADADVVDPDPATAPDIGPIEDDFSAVVGSARVLFEATDEWNLFAGVSQGFRAPNLADLTRFDASRSGEVETPAPGLEPEDFVTFEAGAKVLLDEDLGLEGYGAYYYTLVEDLIVRFPTGNLIDGDPEVTKDNVGDGFVHGVELSLSWNFYRTFSLFGTATWLEGEVENIVGGNEKSAPLSRLQPAAGLVGIRWDSPGGKYWVEGTVLIVDNQDRLSPRDIGDVQRIPPGGTPGYTVYTLRGGLEVTDGMNVFAAVENLTDKNYRVHGSGQNEAGTNVILGADWTF